MNTQPQRHLLTTVETALTKILQTNPTPEMLLEVYKEELKFQSLLLECKTTLEATKIRAKMKTNIATIETGLFEVEPPLDAIEFEVA